MRKLEDLSRGAADEERRDLRNQGVDSRVVHRAVKVSQSFAPSPQQPSPRQRGRPTHSRLIANDDCLGKAIVKRSVVAVDECERQPETEESQ